MNTGTPAETLTPAQLAASARQITARRPRLPGQDPAGLAAAAAVVRANLISQWPAASPGALTAAMLAAALIAARAGITALPAPHQQERNEATCPGATSRSSSTAS
jgi:hypothetical protein